LVKLLELNVVSGGRSGSETGHHPGGAAGKSQASLPWKRNGTIKEFGKAGVFLLSAAASYITGSSVAVDGGMIRTVW